MTVSDLLERCSSAELSEWQAYHQLDEEDRRKAEARDRAKADRVAPAETMGRPAGQAAEIIAAYEGQEA